MSSKIPETLSISLPHTTDQLNQLFVIDTDSLELWGTYDLGGGVTGETPRS